VRRHLRATPLAVLLLLGAASRAAAEGAPAPGQLPPTASEIRTLYDRLQVGMPIGEVAALANRPRLGRPAPGAEAVTSWLLWSAPGSGPTAVLRAAFRNDRLARLEYELFGDEYQRLAKESDPTVEMGEAELRRLWRRTQAAEDCQQALEAFHRLLLGLQDRLTTAEQQDWVRALEQRRAVERQLTHPAR
jgi:hypothetical protein